MTGTPPPDHGRPDPLGIRASDAEREATVRLLHGALGEGRLDLPEMESRVAAAYAAAFRVELPPLLEDLPSEKDHVRALGGETDAPSWRALWVGLVWRLRAGLWDGPGDARAIAPGAAQQRVAALLLILAAMWLLVAAVVGAAL